MQSQDRTLYLVLLEYSLRRCFLGLPPREALLQAEATVAETINPKVTVPEGAPFREA